MITSKHTRDNILKKVLDEPELFTQFLKDYVPMPELDLVQPDDIEDITERFLPLNQTARDADTVKRIWLHNNGLPSMYVIAIVEHESQVNYRMPYKFLQYIAHVWDDYEKERQKERGQGIIKHKDFLYPPVLPVVLYDGKGAWTAPHRMIEKVYLPGVFEKYIPNFEYILVDLQKYSIAELAQNRNAMSLVFILDKLRTSREFEQLKDVLPLGFLDALELETPERLIQLIGDVLHVFMAHSGMSRRQIESITGGFANRRLIDMFTLAEEGFRKERDKERREGRKEGRVAAAKSIAKKMLEAGDSIQKVIDVTDLPKETIELLQREIDTNMK